MGDDLPPVQSNGLHFDPTDGEGAPVQAGEMVSSENEQGLQSDASNIENDGSISSWNESISSKSKPNVIILMFDVSNSDTLYTGWISI